MSTQRATKIRTAPAESPLGTSHIEKPRAKAESQTLPRVRLISPVRTGGAYSNLPSDFTDSEYEQLCFDLLQGGQSVTRVDSARTSDCVVPRQSADAVEHQLPDRIHSSGGLHNVDAHFFSRQRSSSASLPDAKRWCSQFTCAYVEILNGRRGLHQIERWLSSRMRKQIKSSLAPSGRHHARRHQPLSIHSLHVSEPLDSVIEGSCVVRKGQTFRAMTFRFEGWDGKWICTHLRIHG